MKLVDRYILRSHLGPFVFGFMVTTGVLFTEVFKNFLDEFLAKGVSPFTIAEVLVLSLGHTVALSIPMAVLVASLMAFGQMAADNEITALKAAGLHLYRIMAPVLVVATLLCIAMLVFNNLVLPESNHRLAGLTSDIGRKRPTVNIEAGRFVDDFKGYQLYIGSKDEKTDEIRDVQIVVLHSGHTPDLVVAPRGRLHFEDDGNTLYIELFDGEMQSVPEIERPGEDVLRRTHFTIHTVIIRDVGTSLERTDRKYRGDREMSIGMMRESIAEKHQQIRQLHERLGEQSEQLLEMRLGLLDPEKRAKYFATHAILPPGKLTQGSEERLREAVSMQAGSVEAYLRQIRQLQVEIHKKYAIPFACIVFVLVGAPLAIRSGRSSMTMAIAFSILCFFVYYLFLTGGEKLADRELLPPPVAMWAANVVFGILGMWLTWRTSTESEVIRWERLDPRRWALGRWFRRPQARAAGA